MKKTVSILTLIAMLFSMSLMPAAAETAETDGSTAVMDFSVGLFRNCFDAEGNVVISPLSVMYALAMTMNGAEGETLAQMEQALGLTRDELNMLLPGILAAPENSDLKSANSVWIKNDEGFTVNGSFIETNAGLYDADVFTEAFDAGTVEKINAWVSEGTDGMIPGILNSIPPEAVMYLINAVAFGAEWQIPYEEEDIGDGIFTAGDGTQQDAVMMHATESIYLENEYATGFMKLYKGQNYAFLALLPDEGMTLGEYVQTLTGESVASLMDNAQYLDVTTAIPQFETDFSIEMAETLREMGIVDAFDMNLADLSGIGAYDGANLAISGVTHKAHIAVDDRGTVAAAATLVGVEAMSAPMMEEPKEVILDRPFVYMIVDCETQLPVFMGAIETLAE